MRRPAALAVLLAVCVTSARVGATVPSKLPPSAITAYQIDPGDGQVQIVLGEGKVWALRGSDLHPLDLASTVLVGRVAEDPRRWGPVFSGGSLWSLRLDLDHECAPSDFPYLLEQIDPTTNSVVNAIDLPSWCRYGTDNRDLSPTLVAGGGAVWITASNPPASSLVNVQIVRVDTATGAVATTPPSGTRAVVGSDESGAWVATAGTAGLSPQHDNNLGLSVTGPIQLDRVDQTGAVVAQDLLPSARFQAAGYATDGDGLWVTYAKVNPSSTKKATIALARVTPSGKRIVAAGVSPWSVAAGDGQVWFLGTLAVGHTAAPTPRKKWVLGRIDPDTGMVLRTIRLKLPIDSANDPQVVGPKIVGVMGGAVWIDTVIAVGRAHQQQLIRVAI